MPETKKIAEISVVADTETGQDKVGDVQGGFCIPIEDHVRRYGSEGLLRTLSFMIANVVEAQREVNRKAYADTKASNPLASFDSL